MKHDSAGVNTDIYIKLKISYEKVEPMLVEFYITNFKY